MTVQKTETNGTQTAETPKTTTTSKTPTRSSRSQAQEDKQTSALSVKEKPVELLREFN